MGLTNIYAKLLVAALCLFWTGCIVVKPCGCDEKQYNSIGGSQVSPTVHFESKQWKSSGVLTDSLLKVDTALQHRLQSIKQIWPEYMTPSTSNGDLFVYKFIPLVGTLIIDTKIDTLKDNEKIIIIGE